LLGWCGSGCLLRFEVVNIPFNDSAAVTAAMQLIQSDAFFFGDLAGKR
jgi:hypothetical protein